jgi:sterol desaturase/sphingolipid hydroxylase (fatty acid hydroxylase superfamily)
MNLLDSLSAIAMITAGMALVALIETVAPLRAPGRWSRAHRGPDLALTVLTFAANLVLNVALLALVVAVESAGIGVLHRLSVPPLPAAILAVAGLDLAFYAAHVSWHKIPVLWRVHAVHHADPTLDVTTSFRQHPMEGLLRAAAMAAAIVVIGPSAAAFAAYRSASALTALLEHTNLRAPRRLDEALALVTTWPHLHKIHHSRVRAETDTNYGNRLSVWDRFFGTFTPSRRAETVVFGLDGFDAPELQTTTGLLALPFRRGERTRASAPTVS